MFENLKKQDDVKEEGDVIFGSVLETNVYNFTVDSAYADESDGGAAFLRVSLISDEGRTLTQTVYFTSGDAKGNSITYDVKDKKRKPTGEKRYLPGYVIASDIHEHITGIPLAEMVTENKLIKTWDNEAKKEVPQEKAVLTDLLGKSIKLGIQEQLVIKQVNKDGKWVNSDDTRKQNEIVKVFNAETNQTTDEKAANTEAQFMDKWIKSYAGKVIDKTGGKVKAEASAKPTGSDTPKKKMFG